MGDRGTAGREGKDAGFFGLRRSVLLVSSERAPPGADAPGSRATRPRPALSGTTAATPQYPGQAARVDEAGAGPGPGAPQPRTCGPRGTLRAAQYSGAAM